MPNRVWDIERYKERLDAALEAENWDEVDRVRVAFKRRILELTRSGGREKELAAARDAMAHSLDRFRLSKQIQLEAGAFGAATRLLADAETAGMAADL